MLDALHQAQLREHGGAAGVRDDSALESPLARPRNRYAYSKRRDWSALAAAYIFGLSRNHGYVDGNKRVAFLAAYVFLALNGLELDAEEPEIVAAMEGVAAGDVTEASLAKWLRARLRPLET
jgi:death on curing protein